jgi:nucleoside-diphosphate-sugar epimerase
MGKVFITGATGQVGSHLAYYIASSKSLGITDPKDIICIVRKPTPQRTLFLRKLGITIFDCDLQDKPKMAKIFEEHDIEYVFHAAAFIDPSGDFRTIYKANVINTRNILEILGESRAKYFVFCSSMAVYDSFASADLVNVIDEKSPIGPLKNDVPYAISKRKNEILIQEYVKKYPSKIFLITRLGVIIGARDRLIIPTFVQFMTISFIPKLIANGKDYIAVTSPLDIARAQVFLVEVAKKKPSLSGQVFNVMGKPITYRQMFNYIANYFGLLVPQISIPLWSFKAAKPILHWIKRMFPKNQFVQKALSPSAMEFIGKSFIYKTDKIEQLGFKFMVTAEETILAALRESYPCAKIKEPYLITEWKRQILEFSKILEESIKKVEEKAKKNIELKNPNSESEINKAEIDLKRANELEMKAKHIARTIKKEKKSEIQQAKNQIKKAERISRQAHATKEAAEKTFKQTKRNNGIIN